MVNQKKSVAKKQHFGLGATGVIRTRGFRDLQSLALGLSATVAFLLIIQHWYGS